MGAPRYATLDVFGPADALDLCRDWGGRTIRCGSSLSSPATNHAGGLHDRVLRPRIGCSATGTACSTTSRSSRRPRAVGPPTPGRCRVRRWSGPGCPLRCGVPGGDLRHAHRSRCRAPRSDDVPAQPSPRVARGRCGHGYLDVVAVHLSHYNPPTPELSDRLRPWGARVVDDGTTVPVGEPVVRSGHASRTLVLGGARGRQVDVRRGAAGRRTPASPTWRPGCPGGRPGVGAADRAAPGRRPPGWTTSRPRMSCRRCETPGSRCCWTPRHLADRAPGPRCVDRRRLDCRRRRHHGPAGALRRATMPVVAVSNEVGSGVVPPTPAGRRFRDLSGRSTPRSRPSRSRWC